MFHWLLHLKGPWKFRHAAVAVGHKVYSFGGYFEMRHIEVHVFNTVSLSWVTLPPPLETTTTGRGEGVEEEQQPLEVPSMRRDHTAVLIDDFIYIWGGGYSYRGEYCNVLYAFDVNTHGWHAPRISGTVPVARCNHSACVLQKVMYVYGGYTHKTGYTNDVYKLDTATMVWALIDSGGGGVSSAPTSSCHTATVIGTKMFVFGGQCHLNNNVRVFDLETNRWLSTPPSAPPPPLLPEGRRGHSAFAYNGELYIFGGDNLNRFFNDVWRFNPETFSWKKVEPRGRGPCLVRTRMCCCAVGDHIILFGGHGYTIDDDLYILDLSPSLKTLCKLAVIQYCVEQSGLPHDIRWELEAMTANSGGSTAQRTNVLVQ